MKGRKKFTHRFCGVRFGFDSKKYAVNSKNGGG